MLIDVPCEMGFDAKIILLRISWVKACALLYVKM
jgi:hypothetical protein